MLESEYALEHVDKDKKVPQFFLVEQRIETIHYYKENLKDLVALRGQVSDHESPDAKLIKRAITTRARELERLGQYDAAVHVAGYRVLGKRKRRR